jgi:hypothetical protein
LFIMAAIAGSTCAATAIAGDWVRWDTSVGGNGHWYLAVVVPDSGINWDEANTIAQGTGGYLATMHSNAENEFIYALIDSPEFWRPPDPWGNCEGPYFGGLRDPDDPNTWIWSSGEPWTYDYWSPGEPNNFGGHEDRTIYFGPGGSMTQLWNDVGWEYMSLGFIVEHECPADFNGDGILNSLDFIAFLNAFTSGDPSADFNLDGSVNSLDFIAFLNVFVAGC